MSDISRIALLLPTAVLAADVTVMLPAAVAPHLVSYDDEGKPNSVQYRLLKPLLLNELLEERRNSEQLLTQVAEFEQWISGLEDIAGSTR